MVEEYAKQETLKLEATSSSEESVDFITTAVRTSNPTDFLQFSSISVAELCLQT
jgi:hypothetical protein